MVLMISKRLTVNQNLSDPNTVKNYWKKMDKKS